MLAYENFDLYITPSGKDFQISVTDSPSGQGTHSISAAMVEELKKSSLTALLNPKGFGGKLYQIIFQGDIGHRFEAGWALTEHQGKGLRIRLHLNEAILFQSLAWEYLYHPARNYFFATSKYTPVVRYLDIGKPEKPLRTELPLQILVLLSSPVDLPNERQIDIEAEWSNLKDAVAPLVQAGKVKLERLPSASLMALRRRIRQKHIDVLHLLGHGHFDEQREEAALLLEDNQKNAAQGSADELNVMLRDHLPQLVYLNSCDTARSGQRDMFAGLAQGLAQEGVPAIVAMQREIVMTTAHTIATEFYRALADGFPVDAALAEGRVAAYKTVGPAEWGIPVLFMRSPDGVLFEMRESRPEAEVDTIDPKTVDQLQVVETLLQSTTMQNNALRDDVVNALPSHIRNSVQRRPILKPDVRNIVSACLNYQGGMEALIAVLEDEFEGKSNAVITLKALLSLT